MHWNKFLEPKVSKVTGSRALYFLKEVDYRLRPMTVRYDEGRVRGFVGWTLFSLEARKGSKLRENLRRMLAYSNLVGVGKVQECGLRGSEGEVGGRDSSYSRIVDLRHGFTWTISQEQGPVQKILGYASPSPLGSGPMSYGTQWSGAQSIARSRGSGVGLSLRFHGCIQPLVLTPCFPPHV